jgi:hypothetical protein
MSNFNAINQPYGWGLRPITPYNRDQTSSANFVETVPKIVEPPEIMGPKNTSSVNDLDSFFLSNNSYLPGASSTTYRDYPANPDLQIPRPQQTQANNYINLASQSLHVAPDTIMKVFFSDDNIDHLRTSVVNKVKEVTAKTGVGGDNNGIDIKQPNMDDMFYYMVNKYQNYKIYNGSICFTNLRNGTNVKAELIKLNTDVLQDYISKLISQINMYIYYYKDASQLPEQLSLPLLTSMKGSKTLEYNTGFTSGNSIGVASYNQVGNIL